MQVLFDLRPPKLVHLQETHVDPLRLLAMLLFGVFVVLSLFNVTHTLLNLRSVRAQLASVRGEESALVGQKAVVDAEIGTMRAYREKIKAYVAFSKEEMPSVEFLAALEGAVPSSVKITTLNMTPRNVLLRGVALTDQDIIDIGGRLDAMKNIVNKVDAPVTAKVTSGSSIILEFTMPCTIKTVSEVAAAVPPATPPAPEGGSPQ